MLGQRIHDFLQYLRFEKRYSPHTTESYENDLTQFRDYIQLTFELSEVKPIQHFHIRSWLASMHDEQRTARTINRKISSLSSFYKFLLRQGDVDKNPVRMLHSLKLPERLPQFLKEKETQFLFEEITFDDGFKGATERLILDLLYQTGMRRAELVSFKETDIEWSLGQIRILGKGNKERLIPVGEELLQSIKNYIALKKENSFKHNANLLMTHKGKPVTNTYIYGVAKRYLGMVTTLKKKSPHILRHSFATHLLNNGANIQAIKDLLGHSSLAATQVYTHTNIEKLKEIHKKAHPRG